MKIPHRRSPRVGPSSDMAAHGLYLLASCIGDDWASCRIVDLSYGGAGLELRGPWPGSSEEFLLVRYVAPVTGKPVTFCAQVRHQTITDTGTLRIGIEFVNAPIPDQGRERDWKPPTKLQTEVDAQGG